MGGRSRAATVVFWGAAAIGWVIILLGVRGVFHDSSATRPGDLAGWFAGLLVVHDVVLVPVAFGVAWLVGRVLPDRAVVPARLGLAASAVVVAVAFPLVRGYGERDANPSLLPLPYGRNLAIALVLVWVVVVGATAISRVVRTRR
jgi:hypothetical protein